MAMFNQTYDSSLWMDSNHSMRSNSKGTRQRGRKIHGGGKICDFRVKSLFISETVQDSPMER